MREQHQAVTMIAPDTWHHLSRHLAPTATQTMSDGQDLAWYGSAQYPPSSASTHLLPTRKTRVKTPKLPELPKCRCSTAVPPVPVPFPLQDSSFPLIARHAQGHRLRPHVHVHLHLSPTLFPSPRFPFQCQMPARLDP